MEPLPAWPGAPTLTKEKRSLGLRVSRADHLQMSATKTHLKQPSVRTLRSCRMNQMPILSWVS